MSQSIGPSPDYGVKLVKFGFFVLLIALIGYRTVDDFKSAGEISLSQDIPKIQYDLPDGRVDTVKQR